MPSLLLAALAEGEAPTADFSNDTIWIVLVKALLVFVFLMLNTLLLVWAERRVVAYMQNRPGPNRHGPFGLLQSLADGVKLALKEDLIPTAADKFVYVIAPVISTATAFLAFSVIPFGPDFKVPFTDIVTPLQMTDLPVAALMILAIASIGVYGLVLAGWSSGSTYPLLGGVRSSAQVISYEIAMGLSLVGVFLYAGSMSTSTIVSSQANALWWIIPLFPSFVIYAISMVGETNRAPFDLPEAEGELVGGFHTEYTSLKFALFFLAEYVNMVVVSALATTLFLGGWRAPWPLSAIWEGANSGAWPVLWFVLKLWMFLFVFIWLRGTLPRLRYDQFMDFGWKRLIPFALFWTVVVALMRGVQQFTSLSTTQLMVGVAALTVVLLGITVLYDFVQGPSEDEPDRIPTGEIDPFVGGFPAPALPGQTLKRSAGTSTLVAPSQAIEASVVEQAQGDKND